MPHSLRSCDRLDDDHMPAEVHRRWGGSSYPWSQFMAGELLLSCDRHQGDHMTSEGEALRPEEECAKHSKASH